MVVAVDRYISVCWPVKARFLCTRRRAKVCVAGVFIFSILYNIPRWLEFHTEAVSACSLNENATTDVNETTCTAVVYKMEQSELRYDPDYKNYYIFWSYFAIMFLLPFTSLSYFNFAIFLAVSTDL